MSWYCDRCGKKQKDKLFNSVLSSGDVKYNTKNSSFMKENAISSLDNICYQCHHYLFDNSIFTRIEEDKKHDDNPSEDGLSSRFNSECNEFDTEYELIDPKTKLYWNEDYDEIIEIASKDYFQIDYLYKYEYCIEDEECVRCKRKIKKGSVVFTFNRWIYLEEHSVYNDLCSECHNYLSLDGLLKSYRKTIDNEHQKDKSSGISSRFNLICNNFDIEHNFINYKNMKLYDEDGFYDITFSDNADIIIKEQLYSKSTCAAYKSLIESVNNSFETRFASDFQTYITRLGLIINKIVLNKNFKGKKNYYPELLKYICIDILDNDYIYKKLRKINNSANDVKHSIKDVTTNIKDTLIYYNSMIDSLIKLSNCKAFSMCYINYKHNSSQRDLKKICKTCGRIDPEKLYKCRICNKIVCEDCFNKEKRKCIECFEKD